MRHVLRQMAINKPTQREFSSAGRARPCQGRGHEFEPRNSLQFKIGTQCGGLAEWPCSGLQIRPPRFDSGTRLHNTVTKVTLA